jgi:hypothetical protein
MELQETNTAEQIDILAILETQDATDISVIDPL